MSRIWDISPPVGPGSPVFPGDTPYAQEWSATLAPGCPVNVARIAMSPHVGAHADAPLHYDAAGAAAGAVDLEPYLGPCRVIHAIGRTPLVRWADLGHALDDLPPRVLVRTYERTPVDRWDPYLAALAPDTIERLAALGARLVGIDTASIDPADSKDLPSHQAIRRLGLRVLENLVLDEVPEGAASTLARPQRDAVHHPAPDQRAVAETDAARTARSDRRHRRRRARRGAAFKMLARVSRIMEQLVHAWDVLATMTPPEYSAIRPYLGSSSGFQSAQYRCLEFALGNKNATMLQPHAHHPQRLAAVQQALDAPSLYDEALRLLARRGLPVPATHVDRDWSQPYVESAAVEQAWLTVYRDPKRYWDLYELGEELTDLEDAFRLWRFRHVTTVERIIGSKRGTGGTGGVSYLRRMLDVVLFPEIWRLRTNL